ARTMDLERLLERRAEPPRIRALAAELLARVATSASSARLRKGLSSKDPIALRSVVRGLAWSDDVKSLPTIDRIARRKGPAASAASWAALLLRFRHGKRGGTLSTSNRWLRPEPALVKSIPVAPATRAAAARALKSLRESASSFRLSPEHALRLTCDDRKL